MAKKKVTTDVNATFKNGMNIERTKQAALQGLLLTVFIALLGVFSYIFSMIPAGIFGVIIAKSSTQNQLVYDIQNLVNVLCGVLIFTIGGFTFAKKFGESDAMYAFQNKLDRKLDMRYLVLGVVIAVLAFIFVGTVLNVDFIVGPIKYLSIFISRAERSINEGIKLSFGVRMISTLIIMAIVTPFLIVGARKGYLDKMDLMEDEEKEAIKLEEERTKAE